MPIPLGLTCAAAAAAALLLQQQSSLVSGAERPDADADAVVGVVCVGPRSVTCTSATAVRGVIPSPGAGTFIWRRADGKEIVIGQSEIAKPVGLQTIAPGVISFIGADNVPAKSIVTLRNGDAKWEISVSKTDIDNLRKLRLPKGHYSLLLTADGYKTISYPGIEIQTVPFTVPRLVFVRNPLISGSVGLKDGSPVVGAAISDGSRMVAQTNEKGGFAFMPVDKIPREIVISHPGFAPLTASVFYTGSGDVALGRLVLVTGAHLTVVLEPKCHVCGTSASLYLTMEGGRSSPSRRLIGTKDIPDAPADLTFDDLPAGHYGLVLTGPRAIAQRVDQFDVKQGEQKKQSVTIASFRLDGSVALGRELLGGVRINFTSIDGLINRETLSRPDGTFDVEVWSEGRYTVTISGADLSRPFITRCDLLATTAGLDFILPVRTISGQVVDKATQQPVAGATVSVQYLGEIALSNVPFGADAEGRFVIPNARIGDYQFIATAPGYDTGAPSKLHVADEDSDMSVALPLRRADRLSVRVTDESGQPLSGAFVISRVANHGQTCDGPVITGSDGLADVAIDPGAVILVYVIMADGRLAVLRTTHGDSGEPHSVVLQEGTSTVVGRIVDSQRGPQAGMSVLMTYNDELIPPVISRFLSGLQNLSIESGPDGLIALGRLPAGRYRFWSYHGLNDLVMLYREPNLHGPPTTVSLTKAAATVDIVRKMVP